MELLYNAERKKCKYSHQHGVENIIRKNLLVLNTTDNESIDSCKIDLIGINSYSPTLSIKEELQNAIYSLSLKNDESFSTIGNFKHSTEKMVRFKDCNSL